MPAQKMAGSVSPAGLAGIDQDEPLRMFYEPGVNRQPITPIAIAHDPQRSSRFTSHLGIFDAHPAGTDGVDSNHHGTPSFKAADHPSAFMVNNRLLRGEIFLTLLARRPGHHDFATSLTHHVLDAHHLLPRR